MRLADWPLLLRAADPDLTRLRMGLRPVLAVSITALLLWAFSSWAHVPLALLLVGISLAMMATVQANDPDPGARRMTQALLVLPAAGGFTLGMALAGNAWLSRVGLVAVVFASVRIRRWGPRAQAIGMIAYMAYFFALFFAAPLAALPVLLGSIALGMGVAYAVRFALVPDDEAASLRAGLAALPSSVALALGAVAEALRGPAWGPHQSRAVSHALRRVNRVTLAVDEHLDARSVLGLAPDLTAAELQARTFEVELALDRVAASIAAKARAGLSPLQHQALASRLDEAAERIRRGGQPVCAAPAGEQGPVADGLIEDLLSALDRLRCPGTAGAPAALRLKPPSKPGANPALATRQAIQAALAVGLSILAGVALSPSHWYWAVIGAYIMFIKATSLGETLVRGWHRVLGTTAGVGAGIVLASAIAGHEALELTVAIGAIFLGFYLIRIYYAGLVFAITLVLAMLYAMLGRFSPGVMLVRLETTLAGCVIGGAVAAMVLRSPTRQKVRTAAAQVLSQLAEAIHVAVFACGRTPGVPEGIRQAERSLEALREASRPLTMPVFTVVDRAYREEVHLIDAAVFCTRQLASVMGASQLAPEALRELMSTAARVEANARAIAEALEAEPGERPTMQDVAATGEALPAARDERAGCRAAFYWLERVNDVLVILSHQINERAR